MVYGRYGRERERSPPPYRRGNDYQRGRDYDYDQRRRRGEESCMSFAEFMKRKNFPQSVTPIQASIEYEKYLKEHKGSIKKSYFRDNKNSESLRSKYDPVRIREIIEKNKSEAKQLAYEFIQLDDVRQHLAKVYESEAKEFAPEQSWKPENMKKDFELLVKLVRALDSEKDIGSNPLFEQENAVDFGSDDVVAIAEQMDKFLLYACRVHGVDYYKGKEMPHTYLEDKVERVFMRRGPKPENAPEATAEAAPSADPQDTPYLEDVKKFWEDRIKNGNAVLANLLKEGHVERELSDCVQKQIQEIDKNKFMCKLCTKLFKGEEFVIKHFHNKHCDVISQYKLDVLEYMYEQNFMKDESFTGHLQEKLSQLLPTDTVEAQAYKERLDSPDTYSSRKYDRRDNAGSFRRKTYAPPERKPYVDLDAPREKTETRDLLDYGDL